MTGSLALVGCTTLSVTNICPDAYFPQKATVAWMVTHAPNDVWNDFEEMFKTEDELKICKKEEK